MTHLAMPMALFPHKLMVGMNPGDGGEELKTVSSKSIQDIGVAAVVVSLQKKKKRRSKWNNVFFSCSHSEPVAVVDDV